MQEINLLQSKIRDTSFSWQKQSRIIIALLSVVLIALVGLGAVFFLLNRSTEQKLTDAKNQGIEIQKNISSRNAEVKNASSFQAQLANLKTLVGAHTYLSPLLVELGKSTYIKSQYVILDATNDGKIHLEGRTASYDDLGKLVLGLSTSSQFKNIQLKSVVPSSGKTNAYQFSLDMEVNPEIFTKK